MSALVVLPSAFGFAISLLVVWASWLRVRLTRDQPWRLVERMSALALLYCALELWWRLGLGTNLMSATLVFRLQFFAAGIWCMLAVPQETRTSWKPASGFRWAHALVMGGGALAALVPGVMTRNTLLSWELPVFGTALTLASPTDAGIALGALAVATIVGLFGHAVLRAWRGVPSAAADAGGYAVLMLTGVNDMLILSAHLPSVPLVPLGFASQGLLSLMDLVRAEARAQLQLRALTVDLEHQVAARSTELARAREDVVRNEKLAALGRLSAGVAHEINNPAGVVLASLQFVSRELAAGNHGDEDVREAIADGIVGIERIAHVVRQLQESGRSATTAPAELGPVSVREAVEHAIRQLGPSTGGTVEIRSEVPDGLWVVGQPRLLQQALLNVLSNAQRAAAEGRGPGRATVTAQQRATEVVLNIEDDGPGIQQELHGKVFEPFFSTRTVGQGTGLGLTVARSLIQAQRGELALAETRPGRTVFTVRLDSSPAPLAAAPPPTPFPVRATPEVLVVDDDPLVLRAIARQLGQHYQVTQAQTVVEGLALLEARPTRFAAVLCDIMMPDGGAPTLLPIVSRRWPALASRMLFITGGTTTETSDAFFEAHFDRVLRKPIETADLLAKLTAVVRPAAEAKPDDAEQKKPA